MTDSNTEKPRNYLIPTLVSALIVVVAQAWYMADMKHQLDNLRSDATDTPATQQAALGMQSAMPAANAAAMTSTPNTPPQAQTNNQAHNPIRRSPFDDDFFQRAFNTNGNWDPYAEIQRVQQEMDAMMSNAFRGFDRNTGANTRFDSQDINADIDIEDKGDKYLVEVPLPGTNKDNIQVNLEDQTLTISGEQRTTNKQNDASGNSVFHSQKTSMFSRSITLPGAVKPGSMHTEFDKDKLKVTITKAA
jgi:HSP20 family protein